MLAMLAVFVLMMDLVLPIGQMKAAASNKTIEITVDGKRLWPDVPPAIKDGRVMVPFRVIFEALGTKFYWDNKKKTITSTKNDTSFELSINSKHAYVNGSRMTMDVAPMIKDGRTLVPLRFVGEAYDSYVDWDGKNRKVTITADGSKPVDPPPVKTYSLYFNDKRVDTSTPPIIKNNRVHVAMESLLEQMDGEVLWHDHGSRMAIYVDDVELIIYSGEKYALINGQYIYTTENPIIHNGKYYIPLSFLKETFGGTSTYNSATKTVYIKINKAKFESDFLKVETVNIVRPQNIPAATLTGQRRLMVSDNPEMLDPRTVPYAEATLWQDTVDTDKQSMDHRVYGWHVNKLNKKINIGITIENLSSTNDLEIVNAKGIDRSTSNGWYHHDVGLPMAEAVLLNKLAPTGQSAVKANQTVTINQFAVEEEFLIGFLQDLTVKKAAGNGNLNYKIRVVVTQNGSELTSIKYDPLQVDSVNLHPRGVWESSQLQTVLPVYEAGTPEVAYSLSNGITDNLMSGETSLFGSGINVVRNPGHFGATYKVKIPIANLTGQPKTVRVRLGARGGRYSGAVKINNKVLLVPTLKPGTEAVNVIDYKVTGVQDELELEIMHGGGAALPLAVDLITLD
ncbi:copper amine oxidase N-terminal domain-containing protein [Bacillus sp. ISL-47]|uniref:copper amine oxidase N-terminal domain-containing protein n=1 Tax=Bacillus sp. ISL-47 TaxID=2819130 RepID=UPI001BE50861|nr:copper amine oxidase N-terminal domain-containing protein [Bacillus sp. ISL-47]MBT2687092.1 copper amine oxidase N-terminal domain-containing protein [Bacillus sp. ISL-47]MBT2711079.1 copper amine oxidase N-terminal domain-containing protein [Pseudomonas sp. ISL-84]